MSQRPGPKPTPKKPLPKPPPKPQPKPTPGKIQLPPRIPFPDDRGPVPPPRGPRGPADQPLPLPPKGPIPPRGQRGPADEPLTRGDIVLNPNLIKKARDEYSASLPQNARYFDVMTPTKYGGMFGSSAGSGFDAWFEKNYINNPNSPLNDQERLVLQRQIPITQANTQQLQPGYQEAMAQQTYNNLMQQQMANAMAQGVNLGQPQLAQPLTAQVPTARQPAQPNQQAMQNYQNLVGQGIANMQAMGRINPPGQLPKQTPRNISTQSFQTPRPFG